jgi:hypothetical protein
VQPLTDTAGSIQDLFRGISKFLMPSRKILFLIIIGLAVRFALAPWTSWTEDIYPFYRTSVDMLTGAGVYGHAAFSYPPLFAFILYPFVWLLSLFLDPAVWGTVVFEMVDAAQTTGMLVPMVTHPAFNLAVKAPIILADLLMGLILYNFVKEWKDEIWARRIFILWFLNPLVIWVSSISAQIDVFPAILTLLAFICFYRKRFFFAGLALGMGFFFKLYPSYLIIFYLILIIGWEFKIGNQMWKGIALRNALKFIAGGMVSLLTILPAFLTSGWMFDFILRRSGSPNVGGFNIFFFAPYSGTSVGSAASSALPIDISFILFLLLIAATVVIAIIFSMTKKPQKGNILKIFAMGNLMVLVTILLLQPVTNPQHFIWIFPFLLILTLWEGRMERKIFLLTILGLLYLIGLQSFDALLYPTAVYTPLLDPSSLSDSIIRYFTAYDYLARNLLLLTITAVGVLTLITIYLPEKYDPIEMAYAKLKEWRAGREG